MFDNIEQNHSISASFTKKQYTIRARAGIGGKTYPDGDINVAFGDSKIIEFLPQKGYLLTALYVDEKKVATETVFTFKNICSDHLIYAEFKAQTTFCKLEIKSSPNNAGTVIPAGGVHYLNKWDRFDVDVETEKGYSFIGWEIYGDASLYRMGGHAVRVKIWGDAVLKARFGHKLIPHPKITIGMTNIDNNGDDITIRGGVLPLTAFNPEELEVVIGIGNAVFHCNNGSWKYKGENGRRYVYTSRTAKPKVSFSMNLKTGLWSFRVKNSDIYEKLGNNLEAVIVRVMIGGTVYACKVEVDEKTVFSFEPGRNSFYTYEKSDNANCLKIIPDVDMVLRGVYYSACSKKNYLKIKHCLIRMPKNKEAFNGQGRVAVNGSCTLLKLVKSGVESLLYQAIDDRQTRVQIMNQKTLNITAKNELTEYLAVQKGVTVTLQRGRYAGCITFYPTFRTVLHN